MAFSKSGFRLKNKQDEQDFKMSRAENKGKHLVHPVKDEKPFLGVSLVFANESLFGLFSGRW
ncbi:MAG: hypothetical protein Fur0016_31700 [Anaerolineales bacterium]